MRTPEQIAAELVERIRERGTIETLGLPYDAKDSEVWARIAQLAIEADRAQRYEVPAPLAGAIEPTDGGVFRNARGDYLVEPIGDETGELILVRADGTTATMTGDWETGWEA